MNFQGLSARKTEEIVSRILKEELLQIVKRAVEGYARHPKVFKGDGK